MVLCILTLVLVLGIVIIQFLKAHQENGGLLASSS
jgi:hypothetical protein